MPLLRTMKQHGDTLLITGDVVCDCKKSDRLD